MDRSQDWQSRVGERLRSLRQSRGLTLAELSTLSQVAVPALSLIENGKRDFKLSTLVKLVDALKVDLPVLFSIEPTSGLQTGVSDAAATGYDLGDD